MLTSRLNAQPTIPIAQDAISTARPTVNAAGKTGLASPALTDGAVVTSAPSRGLFAPLTLASQSLGSANADLASATASAPDKTPPVPPSTGGVARFDILDPLWDLLGLEFKDMGEGHGEIIDGILDFIDSLPKP